MLPTKGKGRGRGRASAVSQTQGQQQPQIRPGADDSPAEGTSQALATRSHTGDARTEIRAESEDLHVTTEALSSYFQQSLILSTSSVKRPDYGSRGRKIALNVNYFPVELPTGDVYHYDVEIILKRRDFKDSASAASESGKRKFRCMNTKKNREVINEMLRQHNEFDGYIPAFDGMKNLYTKIPLKVAPLKKIVQLKPCMSDIHSDSEEAVPSGDEEPVPSGDVFEVQIKPVVKRETNNNAISLDSVHAFYERKINDVSLEAVMAIETILRNGACFRYVPLGRSFFYPPQSTDDIHNLSGGKEIWFGYHQSLILTEWKPVVNIDVTASTFRRSEPVMEYVCEILQCSERDLLRIPQLRDADIVQLSKKLKGVKVKVTHLPYNREYRVLKLTRENAGKLKFTMTTSEGQRETTVFNYFSERYHTELQYKNLPCLQVHPEQKKIYLPLEVCMIIPGQHSKERLTETETSEMIKVASLPPGERFKQIQDVLRLADFNNDPCDVQFGIRVSSRPLSVEGRVIQAPNIMYHNGRRLTPKDGVWEMKSEKFFQGAVINSWVVLNFANERLCTEADLKKFIDTLIRVGQDYGLILERPLCVHIVRGRNVKVRHELEDIKRRFGNVEFAIVVLQGKSSPLYGEVKQASETELGLVTQCVQATNVKKSNRSVVSNICQKINAKLGGINCSLTPGERPAIFNKPVIIIGADVTHPSPGSGYRPSLAAVVGSLDSYPSRYAVVLRAQRHTNDKKKAEEIIQDLENMIVELLKIFYRETRGKKPEKIIFYRDGVSEGQFVSVRDKELCAIRNACKRLEADYRPGVTCIIVQKKHHTRFIPQDPRDGVGPKRNLPPGTVVDKGISSIIHFDFFLCSHYGLQGTSRAGHYTVISDDNKFTSDELQKLTYYLCHIYARCTRSISIPAPVAYAHLAAYRGTKYLTAQFGESSVNSTEMSGAELRARQNSWAEIITVRPEMKNKMYFV